MALSRHVSSFDSNLAGRLAEQARRQGLLTSSFNVGPNGERTRLYQSWNYKEEDFTVAAAPEPIVDNDDDIWF
jgi:hypothetical protein